MTGTIEIEMTTGAPADPGSVLVVDTGTSIVGIYDPGAGAYRPYSGTAVAEALARIERADVLVTYNGERYDLEMLARFAAKAGVPFEWRGRHDDMQEICWPRILGSCLPDTYRRHLGEPPWFGASYEDDNRRDVMMTYGLWRAWMDDRLNPADGPYLDPAPFGRLLAAPRDGKPVTSWGDRDEALLDVARAIRAAAENLRGVA